MDWWDIPSVEETEIPQVPHQDHVDNVTTRWLSNHRCHQCNDPVLVEPPMSSEYLPWGSRVVADATDVMVRDVAEPPVPRGSAWVGVRKLPDTSTGFGPYQGHGIG